MLASGQHKQKGTEMRKQSRLRFVARVPLNVVVFPLRVFRNRRGNRLMIQPFARRRLKIAFWRKDPVRERARDLWDLMHETNGLCETDARELLELLPHLLPDGRRRQIRIRRVNEEGGQFLEWHRITGKRRRDA